MLDHLFVSPSKESVLSEHASPDKLAVAQVVKYANQATVPNAYLVRVTHRGAKADAADTMTTSSPPNVRWAGNTVLEVSDPRLPVGEERLSVGSLWIAVRRVRR